MRVKHEERGVLATMTTYRDFFDNAAVDWDEHQAPDEIARLRQLLRRLPLQSGAAVLDAGTGTGIIVPLLLERVGEGGRIVGLDLSPGMLAIARAKGFPSCVEFVEGDIQAMPLPNGGFDMAICNATFPHLPDRPQALAELSRVLKPGGWLAICHASGRDEVNRIHQEIGGVVANDELPDGPEMQQLLARAGLKDISVADEPAYYLATARRDWSRREV